MRTLFKYLLPSIALIFFIIFYFRYTESGQKSAYTLLSIYASHKAGVDVKIKKINLYQYPYIRVDAIIEKQYIVFIDGFVHKEELELRYTLNSNCFKSNVCNFDDKIDIKGKIVGWENDINVTGKGDALNGTVEYTFTKQKHHFKNINLHLTDVNSSKLFSLLEQKALFNGKANANIHFDVIEKKHKVGTIRYDVQDDNFYGVQAKFHTKIDVNDDKHTFNLDVISPDILLHLTEGNYDQSKKYAHANYTLDIPDLSHLKKLLKGKYIGEFHAKGEMEYDKHIKIKGLSKDLGGELHFVYDDKTLELYLQNISFQTLMQTLATKPMLDANVTGHAVFTKTTKELHLDTKLKHAKLLPSSLTHTVQKKFSLNLENEIFDKSSLKLTYKDSILSSNFKLANDDVHLILTDTKLNATHNAIDTHIDLKTPKHAVKGKLYARVDTIGEKSLDDVYIKYDGLIEKHYKVKLDGLLSDAFINMDYRLSAARLPSNVCTIVDDINLSGHVSGSFKRLHVVGNGTAMEGKVKYSGIKIKNNFEDVDIHFKNIHALKLFTLLGEPTLPSGKANVDAHFALINDRKKEGHLDFVLKEGKYNTLPLTLKAKADIHNHLIRFVSNATLSTANINISKGEYNLDLNRSKAFYTVKTKNLAPLEPLIGKFIGSFSTSGEITYAKQFQVRGLSSSFGGMIDYLYKQDMLYIDLEKVSLTRFMDLFPYPKMLDAQINGNINYDYKKEKLLVRTDLNNTRFLNSDIVETVFQKSGVNMLKEVFPHSSLRATYQNKVLQGDIILKNNQSHFYLTNTKLDSNDNTVNAVFDLKMQGQEFSGKVYGSLKHPKVNLNMQKLIRYQMDKQLDTYMGKGNRKMMESMPMGGVAKDMAADMGAGFMGMFF